MNTLGIEKTLQEGYNAFFRVTATAVPGSEDFAEYRFPGITVTGYFIETGRYVLTYMPFLNITEVEKW